MYKHISLKIYIFVIMIIINQIGSPNYFEIKRVTKTKYLGLMLEWNFHIGTYTKYQYAHTNYCI